MFDNAKSSMILFVLKNKHDHHNETLFKIKLLKQKSVFSLCTKCGAKIIFLVCCKHKQYENYCSYL